MFAKWLIFFKNEFNRLQAVLSHFIGEETVAWRDAITSLRYPLNGNVRIKTYFLFYKAKFLAIVQTMAL